MIMLQEVSTYVKEREAFLQRLNKLYSSEITYSSIEDELMSIKRILAFNDKQSEKNQSARAQEMKQHRVRLLKLERDRDGMTKEKEGLPGDIQKLSDSFRPVKAKFTKALNAFSLEVDSRVRENINFIRNNLQLAIEESPLLVASEVIKQIQANPLECDRIITNEAPETDDSPVELSSVAFFGKLEELSQCEVKNEILKYSELLSKDDLKRIYNGAYEVLTRSKLLSDFLLNSAAGNPLARSVSNRIGFLIILAHAEHGCIKSADIGKEVARVLLQDVIGNLSFNRLHFKNTQRSESGQTVHLLQSEDPREHILRRPNKESHNRIVEQ